MKNLLAISILGLLIGSCVSVQLPNRSTSPAKGVEYAPPPTPYKEIQSGNADQAWISETTGNTISFLSECRNGNDSNLEQIESESISALANPQSQKTSNFSLNQNQARQSTTKGMLDGVPVMITVVVFKKNNCSFTLVYGGLEKQFPKEEFFFKNFLLSFRAP